jgi:hypothetical protein
MHSLAQILTYGNMFPNGFFTVFVFIGIYFVDFFTEATHKLIVSLPDKGNAALKNLLQK